MSDGRDTRSAGRSSGWFPTFSRLLRWRIWRIRRVWRVVAYGLLVLLLLGGLLNLVGNLYYGHRVKAEIRALKAAGHPVTPADITPPPVPDAENAALLYKAAAKIVEPHQAGADGAGPKGTSSFGYRDHQWDDPQVLACLAQLVREDQGALDLIRQASAKPGYRSETDYSDPAAALFPQFGEARSLAYFLASAAVVASHEGEQAEALERLRLGFVLGRRLSGEAFLVSELVVSAIDGILIRAAEHVLVRGPIPEAQAQALAEELARLDYYEFAGRAWDGERAAGIDFFARARRNRLVGFLSPEPPSSRARLLWWAYAHPLRPILYADEVRFFEVMERHREQVTVPPFKRPPAPPPVPGAHRDSWRHPITDLLVPSPTRASQKIDLSQARRDLMRVAIGLSLYRQTHGSCPPSLEALRRAGWTVPKDVFTDADFVYRPKGDDYLLHSVGFDLKDDGGRQIAWLVDPEERPRTSTPRTYSDDGDIVWGK